MFVEFAMVEVSERSDNVAVIANKLIVVCMRLARPVPALAWCLPLLALSGFAMLLALGIAHLSLWRDWGSTADPFVYGILARKV